MSVSQSTRRVNSASARLAPWWLHAPNALFWWADNSGPGLDQVHPNNCSVRRIKFFGIVVLNWITQLPSPQFFISFNQAQVIIDSVTNLQFLEALPWNNIDPQTIITFISNQKTVNDVHLSDKIFTTTQWYPSPDLCVARSQFQVFTTW